MRFVFLGPPGVGKGTQVKGLCQQYALLHVSTGDIFRAAIANKTPMGLSVKAYLDSGQLVPDDLTSSMMRERLKGADARQGYVLDGFPRTISQANALSEMVVEQGERIGRVIYFDLSEEEVLARIAGRRSCPVCQRIYHTLYYPPEKEGVCDCGGSLTQRRDDLPEIAKERVAVYQRETAPLVAYYEKEGLLSRVNATGSAEEVSTRVRQVVFQK